MAKKTIAPRTLFEIADEIKKDWKTPYYGAVPYLNAMATLRTIDDMYIHDTAQSIVLYFLANAGTWRGETARRIKVELNSLIE